MPAGFISMYSSGRGGQTLSSLIGALVDDIQQSAQSADSDLAASASNAFMLPDLPVSKIQGVRARKGAVWFGRSESATEMVVAVYSSQPVERITAWMLKSQKQESWLAEDASKRPLVQLATPAVSCTAQALCEYAAMMNCVPADSEICQILDGALAAFTLSRHVKSHKPLTFVSGHC